MDYFSAGLPSDREKAIRGLVQGRDLAKQLRAILGRPSPVDADSAAAGDLVVKILGSFTDTISILNRGPSEVNDPTPASWDGRKSEDSDESSKTSALKDRRGCYKRRKTTQTWTRTTSTLIDDGHAWRKYGQKVILNAKHPRNYFRCTHKFDQGCQATKQVQRTEDEPPMYRTTYHGHHTCRNLLKGPQIILDSINPTRDSSVLLSFGTSTNPNNKTSHDEPIFPTFPLVKQEYYGEDQRPCLNHNQSSSSDYLVSPDDLTTFESSGPMATVMSSGGSDHDHGDVISSGVYSCTASTTHSHSLDMDMIVGVGDFDDVFPFEFC